MKLYVHCPDASCGCHHAALAFLKSWGIEVSFGYDGDHYLNYVVPPEWSQGRLDRFTSALNRNIVVMKTRKQ